MNLAFPRRLSGRTWLVILLAAQFCVLQLWLNVEYDDAPRNLHWGLLTAEQPTFLIRSPDWYARGKGFVPDPPTLAPRGAQTIIQGFHPWWGPAFPIIVAAVWRGTGSYRLIQQIVPLAAGLTVLLVYRLAARLFSDRAALLAAALFALMPLIHEYGVISYTECLGALILLVAFWSFVSQQTWAAMLGGVVAVLFKRDSAALYVVVIAAATGWDWWRGGRTLRRRHVALTLAAAALAYGVWRLFAAQQLPSNLADNHFSLAFFLLVAPQMAELFLHPLVCHPADAGATGLAGVARLAPPRG